MKIFDSIPGHLRYLASLYLLGIAAFTSIRIALVGVNSHQLKDVPIDVILGAFLMGARFDTVISGYILMLPLFYFTILAVLRVRNRFASASGTAYLVLLYTIALLICVADIPYFNYFNSRLTINVLSWIDSPAFVVKLVLQDTTYLPFMAGFVVLLYGFLHAVLRLHRKHFPPDRAGSSLQDSGRIAFAGWWLLATLVLFIGIRGRIADKSPIRWGTAFFSTYQFPNQIGLNPVFTFLQSWMDSRRPENKDVTFLDDGDATRFVRHEFGIADTAFQSPVARTVTTRGMPLRKNVVIVLLESMAAWKLSHFGNPDSLTPVLDSLIDCSISYENFYSAGIHTYNGVYATLFGFPAILSRHPMKGLQSMQPFTGLGGELHARGYATAFVCTHDEQFDNMAGFLSSNGFDKIISQKDYPSDEVKSALGVPDHIMFEKAIATMNEMHASGKPFFVAMLSASDHGPYIVPTGIPFVPRHSDIRKAVVEYVDWSIGHFLRLASQQSWYDSTVFVFLADHGSVHESRFVLPLEYLHIPCIIHSPGEMSAPRRMEGVAGQIDLFPTMMSLLDQPFINNTMGMDVLKGKRRIIYFNADDKLGGVDGDYLWISKLGDRELLYRYRDADSRECRDVCLSRADSMKQYTYSMLQVTQAMLRLKLVGPVRIKK